MKFRNAVKKYSPAAIGSGLLALSGHALADSAALVTAATTHLGEATDSGWSVGGLVVGVIAVGVTVAIITTMMRKA